MAFINNAKLKVLTPVIITIILLTGIATSAGADSINSEEKILDLPLAKMYAEHFKVTVDEALNRLHLQNVFPDLEPEITKNEMDTFGGLWIQHEPEFKVIVAFTQNGEKTITKYSDYIPEEIAPYIETKAVEKSLAELLDEQKRLVQAAKAQDIITDSWVDLGNNRIVISIKTSDKNAYDQAVNATKILQPKRLKINLVEELIHPTTDIYGGLTLDDFFWGWPLVTSGFSVIEDGTGTEGIITAGHANDGLWYSGNNLPFEEERYEGSHDVQWHTSSSLDFTNEVQEDEDENTRSIYWTKSRDQQTTYSFYGKYGRSTGYTAGQLETKFCLPEGEHAPPNAEAIWMLITNYFDMDDLIDYGDSGGPWFTQAYALGITHGMGEYEGDECAVYMAINYIEELDLTVMTQ